MQMLEGGSPDRTENLTAGNLGAANATDDQHRDTSDSDSEYVFDLDSAAKSAITAAAEALLREVMSKLSAAIAREKASSSRLDKSESKSTLSLLLQLSSAFNRYVAPLTE